MMIQFGSSLEMYYKFTKSIVLRTTNCVWEFAKANDYHKVITKWWIEDKQFKSKDNRIYPTMNQREPYMYLVALLR